MLNNNTLGMVRQWQRMFSNARYSETNNDDEVNYQKLADAYGIKGYKAESLKELNDILEETNDINEAILIECKISHDCSVYPIVPPGRPIDEFLLNGRKKLKKLIKRFFNFVIKMIMLIMSF